MATEGNMATARVVMVAHHMRGRDYALLAVCFLTILLGYLPYYIMGHGQVLGYFTIYSSEQGENAGFIQLVMQWIGYANKWSLQTAVAREHLVSLLFIVAVSLVVFVLRLRQRMSMPMAALLLFGTILAISPHVFPWYTTVLLVWIPLLIGPLWTRRRLIGKSLAVGVVWYFICLSLLQYYSNSLPRHRVPDWTLYYQVAYLPIVIVLAIAALVGVIHMPGIRKGKQGWYFGSLHTISRIDRPFGKLPLGPTIEIGGIAFAGNRGIQRVEVSVDGGLTWHDATLQPPLSQDSWVFWTWQWTPLLPGSYTLTARATDGTGTVQPSQKQGTVPNGATGYHYVTVQVG